MQFVERLPDRAYLDTHLWLPQLRMSPEHLRVALTFQGSGDDLQAWDMTPHHMRVPRNFLAASRHAGLPFPLIDARVRDFPKVSIRSKVILDAKNPSETYQREGAAALLACDDGILCMRCGAGKTVTALHAAAQLGVPILVVVTDGGLAQQWREEALEFLDLQPDEIGFIGGGLKLGWRDPVHWKKKLTIAVVHSLAKAALANTLPEGITRWFGVSILDEAHLMGAPFFNAAIPPFHGRRWALSATPVREDQFDPLLKYTFGNVVFEYLTPELRPLVLFRKMPTRLNMNDPVEAKEVTSILGDPHRMMIYGFLARRRPKRTADIVMDIRTALNIGREVLVLTHSRDMCESLAQHFPNAGVIHANVPPKKRTEIIRTKNPVISIIQLGKQALNKPKLDTLFLLEPTKKEGAVQQIMGRILRVAADKFQPVVVIYDDENIPMLAKMCASIRTTLRNWPRSKGGRIDFKAVIYGNQNAARNVGQGLHQVSAAQVQVGLAADLRKRQ